MKEVTLKDLQITIDDVFKHYADLVKIAHRAGYEIPCDSCGKDLDDSGDCRLCNPLCS